MNDPSVPAAGAVTRYRIVPSTTRHDPITINIANRSERKHGWPLDQPGLPAAASIGRACPRAARQNPDMLAIRSLRDTSTDHRSAILKAMTQSGFLYWPSSRPVMTVFKSVISASASGHIFHHHIDVLIVTAGPDHASARRRLFVAPRVAENI